MAEYICECQICHIRDIKRSELVEEVDYIHKGTKYYHKKCYDNWKKASPENDEDYKDLIYDFIARDLKVTYDYWVCEAQRKKFLKEKMTNKGILFALKYFYEVKHGDWKDTAALVLFLSYIMTLVHTGPRENVNPLGQSQRLNVRCGKPQNERKSPYKRKRNRNIKLILVC